MEARGCHHNFRMFFSRRGCGWYQIRAELSIILTLIIVYLVVMVMWMVMFWRIWMMGRRWGWGWIIWRVWIRGWWNSGRGRRTATNDIIRRTGNGSWGFKIVSIDHGDLTWGFALGHCLQSPNCVILSGRGIDQPTWSFGTSVTGWKTKYGKFQFLNYNIVAGGTWYAAVIR